MRTLILRQLSNPMNQQQICLLTNKIEGLEANLKPINPYKASGQAPIKYIYSASFLEYFLQDLDYYIYIYICIGLNRE